MNHIDFTQNQVFETTRTPKTNF